MIKFLFNVPVRILIKFFNIKTTYFFVRTPIHFLNAYLYSQYIRFISKSEDIMIVQGFSYPPHNKKNRMILIGDWPSTYLFDKFLKRHPNRLEIKSIERENKVIENADAVVTLFPDVYKYMLTYYKNKNIFYFGNVVNVDEKVVVPSNIVSKKINSNRLLFVGQPFYLDGAMELILSVENLRKKGYELEVDIVGIEPNLIKPKHSWVIVHGYLDKGKSVEKEKYYALLENAKLFVNTTSGWNAFQATLEAMYFYNPIVVRPNDNLAQTFQTLADFSYIVDSKSGSLEDVIINSINQPDQYKNKCINSHYAVKPHTWDAFTKKIVDLIKIKKSDK